MVSTFAAFSPGLLKNAPPMVLSVFEPPRVGPPGGMAYISISKSKSTNSIKYSTISTLRGTVSTLLSSDCLSIMLQNFPETGRSKFTGN